jgi:thioredoxin-like negative regulator of GroEL
VVWRSLAEVLPSLTYAITAALRWVTGIGHYASVPVLLHFVAKWSAPICEPHRQEVEEAARSLGAEVVQVDVDDDPNMVRAYDVLNVPAIAVEGAPERLIVGAFPSSALAERLRPFVR